MWPSVRCCCFRLLLFAVALAVLIFALPDIVVHGQLRDLEVAEYEIIFNGGSSSAGQTVPTKRSKQQQPPGNVKSKVEVLGEVLKRRVEALRQVANRQAEIVFLVDSSSSVGIDNFYNELKFVKKLLADFTVAFHYTRVAVITFSSRSLVLRVADHITNATTRNHKCRLLDDEIPKINYTGGGTFTHGAVVMAQKVLTNARPNAAKALFLITDGYSNGLDPRPAAKIVRDSGVELFTFGIKNGNVRELFDMASEPKSEHSYILDSFEEFEALARRALHEDLHVGNYEEEEERGLCSNLCEEGDSCCDTEAKCACGTHTGHYACICKKGYYGTGLRNDCTPCPAGTFSDAVGPSDIGSCKKCPDDNHQSNPGSTSDDGCKCRKGYEDTGHRLCTVVKCPKLLPPEHGHLVKPSCGHSYNAACGLQCEPGYVLNGSSIRVCSETGHWTGEDAHCLPKMCAPLKQPRHGAMTCSTTESLYGTVCHFTCDLGFTLVGSGARTCLANSSWDGSPSHCRPVMCPPLSLLKDGVIRPSKCTVHRAQYGDTCDFACKKAFTLVGPVKRQCSADGSWSSPDKKTRCIDTSPPELLCPPNVELDTDDNENTATVSWDPPSPVDNSEREPTLTLIPAIILPMKFPIGHSLVTYVSEDSWNNRAKCNFTITVRDVQPPTVDRCISPPTFLSRNKTVVIEWEEPIFSDNSGKPVHVERSRRPGDLFNLGETLVTYTVWDEAGNNNTCVIAIHVQEHACVLPMDPINGHNSCLEEDSGVFCSLTCDEGYAFAIRPAEMYFCAYDGLWSPSDELPFPDCAVTVLPWKALQNGIITLQSEDIPCEDVFFIHQVESKMRRRLSNKVTEYCIDDVDCDVTYVSAECEERFAEAEEQSNYILRRRRRRQSSLTSKDVFVFQDGQSLKNGTEMQNIALKFQFKGKFKLETHIQAANGSSLRKDITDALRMLHLDAEKGELDLQMGHRRLTYKGLRLNSEQPEFLCEIGSVMRNTSCVKCPVGTFYNVMSEDCQACEKGSYQFAEGQLSCLICPDNTSTVQGQSKSPSECKAQCLPGSFSFNGLESCETCDVGTYQTDYARKLCLRCPTNMTTWRRGTRRQQDCRELCASGFVSETGLVPCYPCPKGYHQPTSGQRFCYRCLSESPTQGNNSSTDCSVLSPVELEVNDCFSIPCLNGGSCRALSFSYVCDCKPGYTGMHCELDTDECASCPCQNGGTCQDGIAAYQCNCVSGYQGLNCELDNDDCLSRPCVNNGTCTDKLDDFECECLKGYEGKTCETNTDDCTSSPCLNGGTCVDGVASYDCRCRHGFFGRDCEMDVDECESDPCLNGATCTDVLGKFTCECPKGFEGVFCQVNIDECESNPCLNGAPCVDLEDAFSCMCPPAFSGTLCETELSSDFVMHFSTSGIMDYAHKHGSHRDLSEVSFCFWMKTSDHENYGTPVSYANATVDNLLSLVDYNGFAFYVNGYHVITDVTANDGRWHFLCVTWKSLDGLWHIYKDGALVDSGKNLANGTIISGGGNLVIGQEQDRPMGGFSDAESFIGQMGWLDFWDYVLSPENVSSLATTCDRYRGNVHAWPDFLAGMKGKVKLEDSMFCKGCLTPESFLNGNVTIKGTGVRTVLSYRCKPGFVLKGKETRHCTITGDWQGDEPKCERKSCGFPGYLANGFIKSKAYFYGDVIRYQCTAGYRLVGNDTRTCMPNGQWKERAPTCVEILCPQLTIPEHAKVKNMPSRFRSSTQVAFRCSSGYRLDGASVLTCMDGAWDEDLPVCQPSRCSNPPSIHHGYIVGKSERFTTGDTIHFACDSGYIQMGGKEMSCSADQEWEGEMPHCAAVDCGPPPHILNGSVSVEDTAFDSNATYSCHTGYTMASESTSITCGRTGQWEGKSPFCIPVSCQVPQGIAFGDVMVGTVTLGSTIKYSCMDGYKLSGTVERTCLPSGNWSGTSPKCSRILCEPPEEVPNGGFLEEGPWVAGATVIYACSKGYKRQGPTQSTCLHNGQWSHHSPICVPLECPAPDPISNGFSVGGTYTFGAQVLYGCDDGYHIKGSVTRWCTDYGMWSDVAPSCHKISCGSVDNIKNGRVQLESFLYRSEVRYACDPTFELIGPGVRTCLANGTWSEYEPHCAPAHCPPPEPLEHGLANISLEVVDGTMVEYSCHVGYVLAGHSQRICQSTNKRWSGSLPRCLPINCTVPESPSNGIVQSPSLQYNSIAEYECFTGYKLIGTTTRTCHADGSWSDSTPHCSPLECPIPGDIKNGHVLGDGFTVGVIIQFKCDLGYRISGPLNVTCLESEMWNDDFPTCVAISCPWPLFSPRHGLLEADGHQYQDTGSYTCVVGYELVGGRQRVCLADGTWSGYEPHCEPVQCDLPGNPKHGLAIIADGRSYGDMLRYMCDEGYQIMGDAVRKCLANKTWSGSTGEPYCRPITCPSPPSISDGWYNMSDDGDFRIGVVADYSCRNGFKMEGSNTLVCVSPGHWDGIPPRCLPIRCLFGFPMDIPNGNVIGNDDGNVVFGEVLTFTCNFGYKLIGESQVKCNGQDRWSAPFPVCAITSCPEPPTIFQGKISAQAFTVGAKVTYSCDIGSILVGSVSLTCTTEGKWDGIPGKCEPITCPYPGPVKNGTVAIGELTRKVFEYGQILTVKCQQGFVLQGAHNLVCLETGSWSAPIPSCAPVACPDPDDILNGMWIIDEKMSTNIDLQHTAFSTWGTHVRYSCQDGYTLEGFSATRQCIGDGHWTGTSPQCQPISCKIPDGLHNGRVSYTSLAFRSVAKYDCNEGYRLVGASQCWCTNKGSWSDDEPICQLIVCPELRRPLNGQRLHQMQDNNHTFGAVVMFDCFSEFILVGSAVRTCLADGSWSGDETYCKRIECPPPDAFANGSFRLDSTLVGGTIEYTCSPGYELVGMPIRTCMTHGEWSNPEPACLSIECPELATPAFGKVDEEARTVGAIATYNCYNGYELKGDHQWRKCLENGTWSGTEPMCSLLLCPQPDPVTYGRVTVSSYTVGNDARYVCNEGYVLQGSGTRKCQTDRYWSGDSPMCKPVTCPPMGNLNNGRIIVDKITAVSKEGQYLYGVTLQFICVHKFSLRGPNTIRCLSSGEWNDTLPSCIRSHCDRPPDVDNSFLGDSSHLQVNETVEYACHKGFVMNGTTSALQCSPDGLWNGNIPNCVPVICGPPPEILDAVLQVIIPENQPPNSYGTTALYSCLENFKMSGNSALICDYDSKWFGEKPACKQLVCGPPPILERAIVQVENHEHLSRAVYLCQEGYTMHNAPIIHCHDNGLWDHEDTNLTLECEPVNCGEPPSVNRGKVTFRGTEYGSVTRYSCNAGYRLVSANSKITCGANGRWTGHRPRCHPASCPPPEIPSKSELSNTGEFRYGVTVTYRCKTGYRLVGEATRMCETSGQWSGGIPQCHMIQCQEPHPPLHGYAMLDDRKLGDKAHFICEDGYQLIGENMTECGPDGDWTMPTPMCYAVTCTFPQIPPNSRLKLPMRAVYAFEESVTFGCLMGHLPTNDMSIRCTGDGTWTAPLGQCREAKVDRISCSRPHSRGSNAIILGTSFYAGDTVAYVCGPGMFHSGTGVLRCQEDGNWDTEPHCEALCTKTCSNGGTCLPGGQCRCPPGYSGDQCEKAICILPCLNGGTCVRPYYCLCKSNYVGSRCHISICDPPCGKGGRCMHPNTCQCSDGRWASSC